MSEQGYRIEYTIYRDDEEIGFGSSSTWSSPQQAAHIVSSDIDNYQWETEAGHPDPQDIKREVEQ